MDDSRIGARPPRQSGIEVGWVVPERDVGNDGKHSIAGLGEIRLELAFDIHNESGCDYGEQTGLFLQKLRINITDKVNKKREKTHEDQGSIQIFIMFLYEVVVILISFALEFTIEFIAGTTRHSEDVRKEGWQRLEHCIL